MTTAWTGGQYAVLRVLLAVTAMRVVLTSSAGPLLHVAGLGLAVLLALGSRDRMASLLLAAVLPGHPPWLTGLLVLHAALPPAPYGSWEARGRTDPGDDWRMPPWAPVLAWIAVVVVHLGFADVVTVALLALAAAPQTRRWGWFALLLSAIVRGAPLDAIVVHAFAFDPGWIAPVTTITPATMFYDGTCGLCHRAVRFVLAEDRHGVFTLAPLQSPAFERLVSVEERADLPDTIVVRSRGGRLLVRSRAVLAIGMALGGLWRLAGLLLTAVPPPLADQVYDFVASVRGRFFAPPDAPCPIVPLRLRDRFTPP
jgi:predicted DCC family thiol-disulfide oxidoreductase YuxK